MTRILPFLASILAAATLLLGSPESALACPVCFDSSAENRIAFFQTAAVLSLLPLGMVAGVGAWIRKRIRAVAEEEEVEARDSDSAE